MKATYTKKFTPTHIVTIHGSETQVMLVDGVAYSQNEWDQNVQGDIERMDNGQWLFQGRPFRGSVRMIQQTNTRGRHDRLPCMNSSEE